MIADGVAEGVTQFLGQRRGQAEEAIAELDRLNDELHAKAGELSAHLAERPEVERKALEQIMEMTNPVTLKPYGKTDGEKNLDLVDEFRGWRQKRNELEGWYHYLQGKIAVQSRTCDLQIALLQVVARES